MRLDKLLSNLGYSSRSQCREMIKKGRVQVDGAVCRDIAMHVKDDARIELDGKEIDTRTRRHLMLYKPSGILTAAEDKNQKTVMDILPGMYTSLGCMPVGRLDKDTTGLLLLTTDGDLAHRLISPRHHVDKVYFARVDGEMTEEDERAFSDGIELKDFTAMPAKLEKIENTLYRVTVQEGKYHQVKRMFGARGRKVLALHRFSFGSLVLDKDMQPGDYRELTEKETAALYEAAGKAHE
ncbi:MAG: rRNA pseudouridine synthase [Clostridia bacterium]|nr:rRNA pseudouridine synthase [Clostridia bacterium]